MLLDAYIRVSRIGKRKGERFISPSVQRQQIERWATAHEVQVAEVFEELDESGGRPDRPLFLRTLERVETGESRGVIVAKLDRFGRSVRHGLNAIARIEEAGGVFISVNDGLDLRTPTGKFMLRVMLSMAELELERSREYWDIARERAVGRGVYPSPWAPIGYIRDGNGRLHKDPAVGPIIAEVFRLRIAGTRNAEIAAFLNESGVRRPCGGRFRADSIYKLVRRRAYRGEVHSYPYSNRDAHEALVDEATWELAQTPRQAPRGRATSLVAGLVRCAGCGRLMFPSPPNAKRSPAVTYKCPFEGCPAPATARADELEPALEVLVLGLPAKRHPAVSGKELKRRSTAARKARTAMLDYRQTMREVLAPHLFDEGLEAHERELRDCLLALAQAKLARRQSGTEDDVEPRWHAIDEGGRRALIAERIDCVYVKEGGSQAWERARVCRRGVGPPIPDRFAGAPPFNWKAIEGKTLPLRQLIRWPENQIQVELVKFFAGRDARWPAYAEFAAAGFGQLHAQVMEWGGPFYWGPRVGVEVPNRTVLWNPDRVRGALRPLLRGRRKWPQPKDFRAAGMAWLHGPMYRHGGIEFWAQEFGLRVTKRPFRRWTPERIERELMPFLASRDRCDRYPTAAEFERAGLGALHQAIGHNGGPDYWASRAGLPAPCGPRRRFGPSPDSGMRR